MAPQLDSVGKHADTERPSPSPWEGLPEELKQASLKWRNHILITDDDL